MDGEKTTRPSPLSLSLSLPPPTSPSLPLSLHTPPHSKQALVPCYTEALEIVAETVWALHTARVPPGCTVTVWLLDDGRDPAKRDWVASLGTPRVRYASGRARPAGELNGKAGNLNDALVRLYPPGTPVPHTDVVALFDCDQVADPAFFERTLPRLGDDPRVALVLTPQRFGNVDAASDMFNHANAHFWEAVLPGMAAWGLVVCTGSNLLLRADALCDVGGFPGRSVTEDHLLGMELKAAGYEMRYVPEYLASGEAPDQGAIFRQRSRWAKGHLAAALSRADCPLLNPRLPWVARALYASGAVSYLATALTSPLLAFAPAIALKWGVSPGGLTPAVARAAVPYAVLLHAVSFCLPAPPTSLRGLWFNLLSGHLLWWTYAKAALNAGLRAVGLKRPAKFKTTVKTGVLTAPGGTPRGAGVPGSPRSARAAPAAVAAGTGPFADGGAAALGRDPRSDGSLDRLITMPELLRTLTVAGGGRPGWNVEVSSGGRGLPAAADALAPAETKPSPSRRAGGSTSTAPHPVDDAFSALVFHTSLRWGAVRDLWAPGAALAAALYAVASGAARLAAGTPHTITLIATLWAAVAAIPPLLLFTYVGGLRGRRLGGCATGGGWAALLLAASAIGSAAALAPADYDFREVLSKAYLFYDAQRSGRLPKNHRVAWRGDSALLDRGPTGQDLTGGFYDAGDHLKSAMSMGVAASTLAWGLLEFPAAHAAAGQAGIAAGHVRWAAEWLIKAHLSDNELVGQAGDFGIDHAFWGRPEDLDGQVKKGEMRRPAYVINATHPGSDIAAEASAALSGAAKVFERSDPTFARKCLEHAKSLYRFAKTHRGLAGESVPQLALIYNSTAYRDDLAWAASWLALATGEPAYATEAAAWLEEAWAAEKERWYYIVSNWNNMAWAAQLLLARLTSNPAYVKGTKGFLDSWRLGKHVHYSRKGLAFADDWATLRNSANAALLALVYAKHVGPRAGAPYECWALSQLRYMLGDSGRSYLVGFGARFPTQPHQRAASCPSPPAGCNYLQLHSPDPNPHVLVGALVGGPYRNDTFPDDRQNYAKSEVGIEYNAGFTAAAAGAAEAPTPWAACMQGGGLANVVPKKLRRRGV